MLQPPELPPATLDLPGLSTQQQWRFIEACPRLNVEGRITTAATAVVVAQKDGYAYLLTAEHAVEQLQDKYSLDFYTEKDYPKVAFQLSNVTVYQRYALEDFALLKVDMLDNIVPTIDIAKPIKRRKAPFEAYSVGHSQGNPPTLQIEKVTRKAVVRREEKAIAFFWELQNPPKRGRSGGPLISPEGLLVGLCAAVQDQKGFYTHHDEILAGLKREGFGWLWQKSGN